MDPKGENEPADFREEMLPPCDQYTLEVETAARVFLGEAEPELPIEDAVASMRVIDALYRSAGTGAWEPVRA